MCHHPLLHVLFLRSSVTETKDKGHSPQLHTEGSCHKPPIFSPHHGLAGDQTLLDLPWAGPGETKARGIPCFGLTHSHAILVLEGLHMGIREGTFWPSVFGFNCL